jgi:hypothetical protein
MAADQQRDPQHMDSVQPVEGSAGGRLIPDPE